MITSQTFECRSIADTAEAASKIAALLSFPACVYLEGDMGAGKTTLAGSIIQALGHTGAVTSPTYNLIQEYPVARGVIFHMDLYRLEDPVELDYLAIDDLWSDRSLFLIEWAERGGDRLMTSDHSIYISKMYRESSDLRKIILK